MISTIFIIISFNPSKIFLIGSPLFGGMRINAIPNNIEKKITCTYFYYY